jgi:hypothetical protein
MTLEQVASLSSVIAAIALVLSLIYAGLQFRIQTKAALDTRLISAASVILDFSRLMASNAECARIFRDGLTDLHKLDPVERWRFGSMMQMLVANTQLVLELKSVGNQGHFHGQSMRQIMRTAGAREWWARERNTFAPPVIAALDAVVAGADPPHAARSVSGSDDKHAEGDTG